MIKKILLSLLFFGISISITKADTEHTLGAVVNIVKGIAYVGTFFSWLLLYEILAKKKNKLIIFNLIIAIICGLIGNESINSGEYLVGDQNYDERGQSLITWGWVIIMLNILPIVIAVLKSASKYEVPINDDADKVDLENPNL